MIDLLTMFAILAAFRVKLCIIELPKRLAQKSFSKVTVSCVEWDVKLSPASLSVVCKDEKFNPMLLEFQEHSVVT